MNTKVIATLIAVDCLLAGGWFFKDFKRTNDAKPEISHSEFAYVWDSGSKTVVELSEGRKGRSLHWTLYEDVTIEITDDSIDIKGRKINRRSIKFGDKITEILALEMGMRFEPDDIEGSFWSRARYLKDGIYEMNAEEAHVTVTGDFVIKDD